MDALSHSGCVSEPAPESVGPPPDAVLVRASQSRPLHMAESALACRLHPRYGVYALSFWYWPDLSPDDVMRRVRAEAESRRAFKNPVAATSMRTVMVADLALIELVGDPYRTSHDGHYTVPLDIYVPAPLASPTREQVLHYGQDTFEQLDAALGEPLDNPAKGQFQ